MSFPNFKLPLLLVVLITMLPGIANAQWKYYLNADRYKKLTTYQRAQYNKAKRYFDAKEYKAAAAEFEKFSIQFEDSDKLSYFIFMRGYSLHKAVARGAAIKCYNEVLDYFGEVIDDAAPALFFLGMAHLENGDIREGLELMKEMAEDEDYSQHDLAAGALRRLADNHWNNQEKSQAAGYWKQTVEDFATRNGDEARESLRRLITYHAELKDFAPFGTWLKGIEHAEDNPKWFKQWLGYAASYAWSYIPHNDENKEARKAWWRYFQSQRSTYEELDDVWNFVYYGIYYLSRQNLEPKLLTAYLEEGIAIAKKAKDETAQNAQLGNIIEQLLQSHDYDRARYVASKIIDPIVARFKEVRILNVGGNYKESVVVLQDIEKRADAKNAAQAMSQRASIYHHNLAKYDDAIKLYQQMDNPPSNLWNIQDCYYRMKQMAPAIAILQEIEASFPNDASQAAWYKAHHYDKFGEKTKAVAAARRIMKIYPKSSAASSAHQLLENYGIKTGGTVVD